MSEGLERQTGKTGNLKTNRDHLDHSSVKIGLNTDKSPGDPWKLTITQTPIKDHHLTLVGKVIHLE